MPWVEFIWTKRALAKIAANQVTRAQAQYVVIHARHIVESHSSGRPMALGLTRAKRRVAVVFEWYEPGISVLPITAFEVEPE